MSVIAGQWRRAGLAGGRKNRGGRINGFERKMNEGSANQQSGHRRQRDKQRPGCAQQPAYGALLLLIMLTCSLVRVDGPLVNGAGRSGHQQASGKLDKASLAMMAGQVNMAKDKQELDQHGQ